MINYLTNYRQYNESSIIYFNTIHMFMKEDYLEVGGSHIFDMVLHESEAYWLVDCGSIHFYDPRYVSTDIYIRSPEYAYIYSSSPSGNIVIPNLMAAVDDQWIEYVDGKYKLFVVLCVLDVTTGDYAFPPENSYAELRLYIKPKGNLPD